MQFFLYTVDQVLLTCSKHLTSYFQSGFEKASYFKTIREEAKANTDIP